ncbi:M28 family peptidase [Hymenobacter sp. ASUV-10]|uniref:M28 family peptidase n=1 Tax=Hymenobacter aranciens TaxID=3063996 RepID=A0ABT9B565_9BACT|nr:M28 family peptidase [Hymenobacter sp. ASUV-10]MDO7873394.1 M28 family peptidase [Hymenobacter sp. ASUV-10]
MKKLLLLAALAGAFTAQAQKKTKIKTKPAPAVQAPPTRQAPVEADWNDHYAGQVTAARLRTHLEVLASDKFEGRETGEPGQHMAAEYVAEQFKTAGLNTTPTLNSYLQNFSLERVSWAPDATLKIGSTTYKWIADFYSLSDVSFDKETEVKPVFVGYGIEQGDYSDYKNLEVKGKDLLIMLGEPTDEKGGARLNPVGNPTKWGADHRAKLQLAIRKGARSVFFVNFNPNSNFAKLAGRLAPTINKTRMVMPGEQEDAIPSVFISPAVGYQLLNTKAAAVEKYLNQTNAKGQPVNPSFKPGTLKIKAIRQHVPFSTENVLGYVEGYEKPDEVLVISAHHDHLGVRGGKVYNGADDDGSGTAAIINMAEVFARAKADGHGPRRSVLFLSVTGEEEGLYGSEYYTKHPVFPLANTVADLNVDMVGRTDPEHEGKADYVYVIGSDKLASQLRVILEAQNEKYSKLNLDYKFDDPADPNRFYYRSDHYNFAVNRVPIAFFFNGVHADYHEETDEIGKIQFDKLEQRAQLVFHTAWELANRKERIVVDSDKE